MSFETLALILSTAVSIFSICATIYQINSNKKTKIMELYFSSQKEAYMNLFEEASKLNKNIEKGLSADIEPLISAGHKAMLLSTHRNAKIIEDFCANLCDLVNSSKNKSVSIEQIEDFKKTLFSTATMLRDELFRYDTMMRKSDKYFVN